MDGSPGDITRDIEQLDLIDGLEVEIIPELPHHLFVGRNLEELRLLADVAVSEVIAANRVTIGQSLTTRHEAQGVSGKIMFLQFPHNPTLPIDLHDLVAVTAADEEVAPADRDYFVGIAGHLDLAEHLTAAGEFDDLTLALKADEVVAVGEFPGAPKLIVRGDAGQRGEFDFLGDVSLAIDFNNPAGASLDQKNPPIRQWLARVNLHTGRGLVFPDDLLGRGDFQRSVEMTKEVISAGKTPAILGILTSVFPLDLTRGGHHADAAGIVIAGQKRMSRQGAESERTEQAHQAADLRESHKANVTGELSRSRWKLRRRQCARLIEPPFGGFGPRIAVPEDRST